METNLYAYFVTLQGRPMSAIADAERHDIYRIKYVYGYILLYFVILSNGHYWSMRFI